LSRKVIYEQQQQQTSLIQLEGFHMAT